MRYAAFVLKVVVVLGLAFSSPAVTRADGSLMSRSAARTTSDAPALASSPVARHGGTVATRERAGGHHPCGVNVCANGLEDSDCCLVGACVCGTVVPPASMAAPLLMAGGGPAVSTATPGGLAPDLTPGDPPPPRTAALAA
ncbi:hypothetical protein [Acuticoccus sediminis]|uniref:hypothetical protein n=1 Tax=Acuticoccus sediminis TaxID=2184697 RepID=UPI001CFDDBD8|nr:hypothetical protein [Acuticoccus sediminis]